MTSWLAASTQGTCSLEPRRKGQILIAVSKVHRHGRSLTIASCSTNVACDKASLRGSGATLQTTPALHSQDLVFWLKYYKERACRSVAVINSVLICASVK